MKLRFYLDVYPGPRSQDYFASTCPSPKGALSKRFAFDVTIPDNIIHGVDAELHEVSRPELVPDHGE